MVLYHQSLHYSKISKGSPPPSPAQPPRRPPSPSLPADADDGQRRRCCLSLSSAADRIHPHRLPPLPPLPPLLLPLPPTTAAAVSTTVALLLIVVVVNSISILLASLVFSNSGWALQPCSLLGEESDLNRHPDVIWQPPPP